MVIGISLTSTVVCVHQTQLVAVILHQENELKKNRNERMTTNPG